MVNMFCTKINSTCWFALSLLLFFMSMHKSYGQAEVDTVFLMQQKVYHNLKEALAEPDSVYILDLSRTKLKQFPPEIFQLKRLRILDLSHNKISEIPEEIGDMILLNGLNMSNNKIRRIPPSITKITDLISLQLNRNVIDSLPIEMGNLKNLEVLELWDNELGFIPDEVKGMNSLRIFELRGILFNEEDQQRIRSLLPDAKVYFSPSCNCK